MAFKTISDAQLKNRKKEETFGFKERPAYHERIVEASRVLETNDISKTLRGAVEFVISHKPDSIPTGPQPKMGFRTVRFIAEAEKDYLCSLETAQTVHLIGTTFGFFSRQQLLITALRKRLSKKTPTTIITPLPDDPYYGRSNFLEHFYRRMCNGYWSQLGPSKKTQERVLSTYAASFSLPYTAMLTDTELWIRHNFAATPVYPLVWIYDRTIGQNDYPQFIYIDAVAAEHKATQSGIVNIHERYRGPTTSPPQFGKAPSRPRKRVAK